jgi:predicted transcriptional regulator
MLQLSMSERRPSGSSDPRITQRGFRPGARGTGHVLGTLESAVIEILWTRGALTVVDVERALRQRRDIAHTTVATTLDRMFRKGYLTREKRGRAFLYAPRYSPAKFHHVMAEEVLGALLGQFTEPAISAFVDLVAQDADALDQLERLIDRRRRQASRRGAQ